MKIRCLLFLLLGQIISYHALSQEARRIRGVINDENNQPLSGVTVSLKNHTITTQTNNDGAFDMTVPQTGNILVFSFVGYNPKEITLGKETVYNIQLLNDNKLLSDVVVVGYGSQRKKDITGSVASISEGEFKKVAMSSLDQGIQGRAAGVQVTSSNGQPGAGMSIRIRGGNSINGGNEPLYVIDGFPITGLPSGGATNGPGVNPLASINPNDIVSIDILKDASATAIYGSRGANGVIIITTRRGKADQNKMTFEAYYGVQQVRKKIDMLSAKDYAILANESEFNSGNGAFVRYTQAQIDSFAMGTDWESQIFRNAPMQNYSIGASGGTAKTQYALSFNYFDQDGIIINSDLKRGSMRLNLDSRLTEKLKIGNTLTINYSKSNIVNNDESVTGITYAALAFNPTQPVYQADGSYTFAAAPLNTINNPVALAREVTNYSKIFRGIATVFGEYEIVKGLKAKVLFGGDYASIGERYYATSKVSAGLDAINGNGFARVGNAQNISWLNENTITYDKSFNELHKINALAGFTVQTTSTERAVASAKGFPNDNLQFNNLGAAQTYLQPNSIYSEGSILSYLARINYSFKNKYLLTLTSRMDGSSRFGKGNKYGFFPSGSLAWQLGEEEFIKDLGFFDDFKVRVSYGKTGNQDISAYQALSSLGSVQYTFGNNVATGFRSNRIANPELRWESTSQADVGIDLSIVNNRINITADVYHKKTTDLLLDVSVPWSSGFNSGLRNVGSVENKGFEIAVNTENIRGKFS